MPTTLTRRTNAHFVHLACGHVYICKCFDPYPHPLEARSHHPHRFVVECIHHPCDGRVEKVVKVVEKES